MIDLLSVKINKDYDYIQGTYPEGDGTWLCSSDLTGFNKGYSYQITGGDAERIEAKQDYLIEKAIYPMIELVCGFLNNFYPVNRQNSDLTFDYSDSELDIRTYRQLIKNVATYSECVFNNNVVSNVLSNPFKAGDLIILNNAIRNNYISYVVDVLNDTLTIDNDRFVNCEEYVLITLMSLPQQVEKVISQMVHYDIFLRDNPTNLKSESIGSYSYSREDVKIGSLDYPQEIVNGLPKKSVNFC